MSVTSKGGISSVIFSLNISQYPTQLFFIFYYIRRRRRALSVVFIQLNEYAWPMNVTRYKYFVDDTMVILAKIKIRFLVFTSFAVLHIFYSSFKSVLSIWLTDFHLIRCALNQNMMTRLNFDTLLLSLNHLITIICEKI